MQILMVFQANTTGIHHFLLLATKTNPYRKQSKFYSCKFLTNIIQMVDFQDS